MVTSIGPDIILSEMDTVSNMFKPDYTLRNPPWWYSLATKLHVSRKMVPEHALLYDLQKINPQIIIYPFDLAIPKRGKYVKSDKKFQTAWVRALNKANEKDEIPEIFKQTFENYVTYSNYLHNLHTAGYYFLNRPVVTDSIRTLMQIEYALIPRLMDSIPKLMPFKKKYREEMNFWQHRNEVMVNNIHLFADKHPGKKMVIITGLLHKYILLDLLTDDAKPIGKIIVKG
jgi:hypothetical protein